jgi:hypothetical protein
VPPRVPGLLRNARPEPTYPVYSDPAGKVYGANAALVFTRPDVTNMLLGVRTAH